VAAGEQRVLAGVAAVGQDHGDAGPDRLTLDQGGVPDPDAGNVGDRVGRPGGQVADGNAKLGCAHPGSLAAGRSRSGPPVSGS
jgi:hypothetical protein